jgi:L-seryl-tRNA(Ser) seleniumtransferase
MEADLMNVTRRRFLQRASLLALLAPGAQSRSPLALPQQRQQKPPDNIYARLGVRPLINAAGTYTALSGSLMPPEVRAAMAEASRHYVSIDELQAAVGKRIAELLGVEAALVTAGAAAAMTLGTAACITGKDPDKIKRLPDTRGLKNEVIIQKSHRFPYDHAVRAVGVTLIEVETRQQMEKAIGERTAMMLFLNYADPLGQVKRAEFVEIGKKAGVPTMIDAAADLPPPSRLSEYTRMGFDLVCFSGGKGLRGPQCSGLLLGRRDLIEAAYLNGSPHSDSIGRAAKVGKEEIIGLLVALELYLQRDHQAQWKEWQQQVAFILQSVADVPGVTKAEMFVPPIANETPHARIQWDEKVIPLKQRDVANRLLEGEPSIAVRPSSEDAPVIEVAVWMLQPGEYQLVARRIREVLTKGA